MRGGAGESRGADRAWGGLCDTGLRLGGRSEVRSLPRTGRESGEAETAGPGRKREEPRRE